MNTGPKLVAYALTLGLALGGGAVVGNVVGPIATTGEDPEEHDDMPAVDVTVAGDEPEAHTGPEGHG